MKVFKTRLLGRKARVIDCWRALNTAFQVIFIKVLFTVIFGQIERS